MGTAIFISYKKGYYTFLFSKGEDMVFEEVNPKVLHQFDLKNDISLIDREFKITFSEVSNRSDEDDVIYRIETLKPV